MKMAIDAASTVRASTSPNPWVGCVLEATDGRRFVGATEPPGGRHAEIVALDAAGPAAAGATVWTTLEPCSHFGRTPPCASALVAAGVARVVVGVADPDPNVSGNGISALREAGIDVTVGVAEREVSEQLAPYLHHRRTGRPWVVLKLASTLDGRTAAPDGSSRWITGPEARTDVHRLRAESDAIVVGAGTVRADDPALTVRHVDGKDPRRIVLGTIPDGAAVLPAESHRGDFGDLLDRLGSEGVVQVLVEGGATVAHDLHAAGTVDQYVIYLAPALFGGDDAVGLFTGAGAATIDAVWRGSLSSVRRLGDDLRLDLIRSPAVGSSTADADLRGVA
ncbi:MAG: bifunctional diaminohydroxyphosphoribosylaminopyrimidine deaminase/5-amino-6-(5-phosphoribosylamino)uracil reductase RibD [Acidimicrobiales bacterium]|nr:bifunctional diaminohydroxyphosphoribosylaminopyrimidine deaminase/5-amino-6-(5-phosphoribosylamino)uracil reductase RibD [Acidimicrobiales bacterium]